MLLTLSLALICATVESWTPSFERKRSVVVFFGKRLQKGMSEMEFGARPLDTKSFAVAEALVESLLAKSSKSSDRDIPAILNECETLCNISAKEAGLSISSKVATLMGSWKLTFVSSSDALRVVGSGLHNVPLTKMEDLFITFRGPGPKNKSAPSLVETAEILRVIGPFPNVRNTLAGSFSFTGDRDEALTLKYDKMVDGNGGVIKASDGSDQRTVRFNGGYVNNKCLVLTAQSTNIDPRHVLVLTRESDMEGELKKLRVDRPADWDIPKPAPQFKFPWSK
jgi:hypothetical protein